MFRCDNWELAILHFHVYPHIYLASPEHCCFKAPPLILKFFLLSLGLGGRGGEGAELTVFSYTK